MIAPITCVLLCLAFLVQRWEWRRAKKWAEHWERSYKSVSDSLLKRVEEAIEAKEAHSGLRQRFDDLCQENLKLRVALNEQVNKVEMLDIATENYKQQVRINEHLESQIAKLRKIISTVVDRYKEIQ